MGRYDYYDNLYPRQLTKAERRERATSMAAKLAKKLGHPLNPVHVEGTKIAKTFWGKAWCDNIETYQDCENRLPRGRSYLRSDSVLDLAVDSGYIAAWVSGSGSRPYEVEIKVAPLSGAQKKRIRAACTAQPLSMLDLLQGKLPQALLEMFRSGPDGIFPRLDELKPYCSCPDSSSLCKHLAAVLYGVGHRLDEKPELLFTLRGLDIASLVAASAGDAQAALAAPPETELGDANLAGVFGIDLASVDAVPSPTLARPAAPARKKPAAKPAAAAKKQPAVKEKVEKPVTRLPEMLAYIRKYTRWSDAEFAAALLMKERTLRTLDTKPDSASGKSFKKVKDLYEEVQRLVQKAKAAKKARRGK